MKNSILLFDPKYPNAESRRVYFDGGKITRCEDIGVSPDLGNVRAAGYLIGSGGAGLREELSPLSNDVMKRLRKHSALAPEGNDLAIKTIKRWISALPQASVEHFLICDTAYFNCLPPKAANYAIPSRMTRSGIKKYGGYGLCHRMAWEKANITRCGLEKLVSIYIGDNTNLAAIRNGDPVETSIGFTSLEGIPSAKTCGDLDSTVIFELHNKGMSFKEINKILSLESGLTGLADKKCGFYDLAARPDDPVNRRVLEILRYVIIKCAGAFTAALGGADMITFSSEDPEGSKEFIRQIRDQLDFLNCKFSILKYDKWEAMAERILPLLKEN
jgi:acetate kinase